MRQSINDDVVAMKNSYANSRDVIAPQYDLFRKATLELSASERALNLQANVGV